MKAIIHQHYWQEDSEDKTGKDHYRILDLLQDKSEQEQKELLEGWQLAVNQGFDNMVEAMKLLETLGMAPGIDSNKFKNEVRIEEVPDDSKQDKDECQHIIALATYTPQKIASLVLCNSI